MAKGVSSASTSRAGIAIYGDSTVDGYGTSPWVQNPLIPNHYHNTEAGLSWASMISGVDGRSVFNNGYSGKSIIDDWAYNNIDQYVFNNSTNVGDVYVFIVFGLNDFGQAGWSTATYTSKYTALINKIKAAGLSPVVVTSDPLSNVNEAFVQNTLVPLQKTIAASNNVPCFDINAPLYSWASYRSNQIDGIHFNNYGHEYKATIARNWITANLST